MYLCKKDLKMDNNITMIVEIPSNEEKEFEKLIKSYRNKYIRKSQDIVDEVLIKNPSFLIQLKKQKVSKPISELREIVWKEYLQDEVEFNIALMKTLPEILKTPKSLIETIVNNRITELKGEELLSEVRNICGEYAGRVYPYIYKVALSSTQSRRSRSGSTFESIIYAVYEALNYPFASQSKVGRKIFTELGLGKKVDSILPNMECYEKRRNKTIIGTMKTSLHNWKEYSQLIKKEIPYIYLLTVDKLISKRKAQEMNSHNIIVVTYDWIANSESLKQMKNIISFEEYLFEEIPFYFNFWKKAG
jgi:hypothetical protein